ncbi:MAG: Gfo/Idh/MocA family oxidoreductase [Chloroflexi bacterium]|nr:Gfo/Idh/MocA family oxidoreductase [Chloroflexota bacterium]
MKQYRIAIIGTGNAVGSHIEAVRQAGERAELAAAVDLDESRVQAICRQHAIPRWYTDTAQMLAEVQPDLVHIVTPPATHLPLALACLEAGAWVYCEKPLCASLADFDRLTAAEAASGRYVSTVFQWRFGSAARHLKRLMAAGEMGRPLLGLCHTLWYRDLAYYQVPWRGKWATEVGGPTMTLGIHLTDLFLWLMGEWEEVWALAATLERPIEVEDVSLALVRFANGAVGNVINSALSPRQESHLRLDFQRATVEVTALYRYNNANWRYSIPDGSPDGEALARWQTIESDVSGSHAVQLQEILDSLDRGERPFVSGSEARRILEFSASLYKSAATRQPVRRGSITPADAFYHAMNGAPLR